MSQPIVYGVVALLCYGVSDFIYKQGATAGLRADHFLVAQGWFFAPLVVIYALATGRLVLEPAALWGSLAGIFIFIGFLYFIRSLATGAISTNASIFRMNFIVTVFLVVVLLGEPLTAHKVAGLMFALLATWLLLGAGDGAAFDMERGRSIVQVVIATVAFGASNFFHTVGLRHGALPETLAVAQALVFMPLATAVVCLRDHRLHIAPVTFRYGAGAAVALLGATIFLLRGVAEGQASVVVPIAQMGFIIAALLGICLLGERLTIRKTIGLVSALAALGVLATT
ncbi:MAG: hypothetical protein JO134_06770 [Xanthobacteraceae bacterium]|nr:hypothetical protein [Xanthobacteraceae bacterium]